MTGPWIRKDEFNCAALDRLERFMKYFLNTHGRTMIIVALCSVMEHRRKMSGSQVFSHQFSE
jgi:hypothetical protein